MIFKDYYKILGLDTNKVNIDDIKSAYREQAKRYHPDVNVGDKAAEERFKDINEAYNILVNQSTRRKYDRIWNNYVGKKKSKAKQAENRKKTSTREEILGILFGVNENKNIEEKNIKTKKSKIPIQGENVETEIPISIVEGFFGLTKTISLRTVDGKMKKFDINIPAGIRNGEKVRLIGQGSPGKNGGKNGDLLIRIKISEDKKYKLIGTDIYTELNISPWEAVLGTKVNIDAIDETIGVYIPQGIETDEEIKIENKGYKDIKKRKRRFYNKSKNNDSKKYV